MHNQICLIIVGFILLLNWVLIGGGVVLVSPLETGIPKWDEIILERFCINCHW